jgi:tetratricopeptide (TPR) repeat protein
MATQNKKTGRQDINAGGFRPPTEPHLATVAVPRSDSLPFEQALLQAAQHQEAGRLPEAEQLVRQILEIRPDCAPAWHLLGLVAYGAGKPDMAIDFLGRAVKCDGKIALFHANLGEMNRQQKHVEKAIVHGRKAVALDPKLVSAHSNLGIAYFDNEEYEKAETYHRNALKLDPNCAPSLNNMGSLARERGEQEKALEWYAKARAVQPGYVEPLNNIGATLVRMSRPEEALAALDQALAQNPNYGEAWCNKGSALLDLEQNAPALACFMQALRCRHDYAEAYVGIARAHKGEYQLDQAEAAARRALELDPASEEAWSTLGGIHTSQGKNELAKAAFGKALEIDPACAGAQMGLGNLMLEDGRFAEAERIFAAAEKSGEDRLSFLFSMVQAKKIKKGDPELAELEAQNIASLPPGKALYVHFSLGKAYDDIGEADKAFPHFIKGCAIKRARLSYDADDKDRAFAGIRQVFSKEFIDKNRGKGFASGKPIFVLGMPRSGTTLTEQILASHPDVFGAGEIYDLLDVAGSRDVQDGKPSFPANIAGMAGEGFAEMGRRYVEGLEKRNPSARRITDKMPINFLHIGLIHLILPQAKIVHVSRHPLDTCISCFTRLFAHNQDATYDLNELGRFYKAYNDMMKHWRQALPAGSFYDIRYEKLVEDTETEARRLVDYCGLDWNDNCLDFHKNERSIRTASVTQVRQPIYKSSLARWKKYEKFLGPLIAGLGDALDGEM